MYLQITTRCNMKCAHCCFSCTEQGEDMSIEVFKKALAYDDECAEIGGGEPTVHPQFWEIIGLALGNTSYVWLATNGKIKDIALILAGLSKREVLGCELSQDAYHEPIDEAVFEAFQSIDKIRDITRRGARKPIYAGRAKDLIDASEIKEGDDTCPCESLIVIPNGNVKFCACEDAPILGNVLDDNLDLHSKLVELYGENYEWSECHRRQPDA